MISKLIFAGYTGSKNQVRTRKKIKFDLKSIFFRVCNNLPNWYFKNQAQIDTAFVGIGRLSTYRWVDYRLNFLMHQKASQWVYRGTNMIFTTPVMSHMSGRILFSCAFYYIFSYANCGKFCLIPKMGIMRGTPCTFL